MSRPDIPYIRHRSKVVYYGGAFLREKGSHMRSEKAREIGKQVRVGEGSGLSPGRGREQLAPRVVRPARERLLVPPGVPGVHCQELPQASSRPGRGDIIAVETDSW